MTEETVNKGSKLIAYSFSYLRTCKKCGNEKELKDFPDMVNLSKAHECKTCRAIYQKAYQTANRVKILANERVRKKRQKELDRQYEDRILTKI